MSKERKFIQVVEPVMKYLAENQHPHTTIIITSTNAQLFEGVMSTVEVLTFIPLNLAEFVDGFEYQAWVGYAWEDVKYPSTGFSKEQLPAAIKANIVRRKQ